MKVLDINICICYTIRVIKEGDTMYTDYAPIPDFPVRNYKGHQVVVVEGGERAKDVLRLARNEELTTRDADGDEIFWIVFADEPRRIWDFTGKALRQTLWSQRTRKGR